ncbi:hypothetical protein BHM03_00009616 [Ensete ventricosum]|nr:hypothetical protein BHM03_00009616 [Ensete ventricosum]
MSRPLARAATYGQAGCRGNRLRPRPLTRGRLDATRASLQGLSLIESAARRRSPIETATHKRLPVGAAATRGTTANRGGDAGRRGGRPLAGQLSTGKGSRCLRRGSGSDGGGAAVRVKEG